MPKMDHRERLASDRKAQTIRGTEGRRVTSAAPTRCFRFAGTLSLFAAGLIALGLRCRAAINGSIGTVEIHLS